MTDTDYDDLSLEEKAQEIQDIVTVYRSEAKEELSVEFLEIQERIDFNNLPYDERKELEELGAAPR